MTSRSSVKGLRESCNQN